MTFVLTEKRARALRRLLRADGAPPDAINHILGDYHRAFEAYNHFYNDMTKADRDRLFSAASKKSPLVDKPVPVSAAETVKRGRGAGKVPAGESFTLVISPDLLARYRELAKSEQRSVAQLIRLAMQAYLATPSRTD